MQSYSYLISFNCQFLYLLLQSMSQLGLHFIQKIQLHFLPSSVLGLLLLCLLDIDAKYLLVRVFFSFWNIVQFFLFCFNMIFLVVIFTCTLKFFVQKNMNTLFYNWFFTKHFFQYIPWCFWRISFYNIMKQGIVCTVLYDT